MSARIRAIAAVLALGLAAESLPAHACAYDNEDQSFSLDTLDHYYPGAYSVVWSAVEARRAGRLTRLTDPDAPKLFMLQRILRAARTFEGLMRTAARSSATGADLPPPVSVLLVDSMLWVRLPADAATRQGEVHAVGPLPGDTIAVLHDDAMGAVVAGRLSLAEAEAQGLLKLLANSTEAAAFHRYYAGVGGTPLTPTVAVR